MSVLHDLAEFISYATFIHARGFEAKLGLEASIPILQCEVHQKEAPSQTQHYSVNSKRSGSVIESLINSDFGDSYQNY